MYICQQRIGNQYQLLFIQTQTILIFIILQSNEHYFNLPKRIVISTVNKDKECIDTERIIDFEETIDIIQYNYSEEYECFLLLSEDKKVYKWSSNDSEFSQQLQSYQDEEGFVFEKQFDTDYQSLMLCGSGKFYLLFNKNHSQNAQQELDGQLDSIINSSNNELFKQLLKNGVSAQLMSYFELEQFDKDVIQIREQILENAKNTFRWQEAQSLFTSLKITLLSVKEIRNVQDYELNYQIHNLKLQSNIYWLELPKEAINKEDHIKISQQIILTQTYKIILVYYYNKHQIQLEYILNKKHVLCKNLQKQIN